MLAPSVEQLPDYLLLMRHGFSESNYAVGEAIKNRDDAPSKYLSKLGSDETYRLTTIGESQAITAGKALCKLLESDTLPLNAFGVALNSGFVRTKQTSGLAFPDLHWNDAPEFGELHWGDLLRMSTRTQWAKHPDIMQALRDDPFSVKFPSGENATDAMQRGILGLARLSTQRPNVDSALLVIHDQMIKAVNMALLGYDKHEYNEFYKTKIKNCAVLIYSKVNPTTGEKSAGYERRALFDTSKGEEALINLDWEDIKPNHSLFDGYNGNQHMTPYFEPKLGRELVKICLSYPKFLDA